MRAEQRQQKRDFFLRTDLDHDCLLFRSFGRSERPRRSGRYGFGNVSDVFRGDDDAGPAVTADLGQRRMLGSFGCHQVALRAFAAPFRPMVA